MRTVSKICSYYKCMDGQGCMPINHALLEYGHPMESIFGKGALFYKLRCSSCGFEDWYVVPKISKKKRTWPYYNESCGVEFESESHETKYVKENKLEAL